MTLPRSPGCALCSESGSGCAAVACLLMCWREAWEGARDAGHAWQCVSRAHTCSCLRPPLLLQRMLLLVLLPLLLQHPVVLLLLLSLCLWQQVQSGSELKGMHGDSLGVLPFYQM